MFLSSDITYHIISLGCSKNLVDSERINGALSSSGFSVSDTPEHADIIIINTCGFIEDAKRESVGIIFDAINDRELLENRRVTRSYIEDGKHKTAYFKRRVVVTGCLVERYYNEIKDEIPEIDFLYGIANDNFVTRLSEAFNIKLIKKGGYLQIPLNKNAAYSYIKISEGCSNNCSYCAIPLIRGPRISYSVESIIKDSMRAVKNGSLELIFVAQDTASYSFNEHKLPHLINRVSEIDDVKWIRLLYFHPDRIDDEIIDLIQYNDKVVKYVDLPFQHVNKNILSSMGREGNSKKYEDLVGKLRERIPEIRIRSTFMVGYPGETDEYFDELMEFISKVKLDKLGCFTYSKEDNTRAALLNNSVPEKVKELRYRTLMETQMEISEERLSELVGKELDVLIEEKVDQRNWLGRTEHDAPEIDGIFYLTAESVSIKSIVKARVVDSTEYDLIGVLS